MRKIRFTFFLICASMMAFAQLPKQYLGLTTNLVEVRNTLKIDSSFVLPLRDTTFPTGQTVYNEGGMVMKSGIPYYHNGTKWNAFGGIFDSTSLSNRINLKLNISDTTAMLNPYLKKVDTIAMLNPYLKKVDTASLSNRINLKLNISDTTAMLGNYAYKNGSNSIGTWGINITGNATTVTTNANLTGVITSVGNATSIASQTGTGTKFVVDNSPTLITPNIGVATATSINTGTTLNGTIFAKSSNVLSLASSNHALTVGGEASGVNFAIGLYSSNCAIQGRNNGTAQSFYINPLGGNVFIGDGSLTGQRTFGVINTGSGTTDISSVEVRSGGGAVNDALKLYAMGASYTSSGILRQDYGVVATGTALSGLSIGTQASAPIEFYTSNTQRWVLGASGNTIITGKFTSSGGGLGYSTGAGGTFTQSTSRTTAVTLNKLCGTITMFSAAQAADAVVQFTLNNSFLEADDYLMVQHIGKTPALVAGSWNFSVTVVAGSAVISVRNVSNSSITEATPLRFTIIKASTN